MPERLELIPILRALAALPGRAVVGVLWVYQRTVSPALPAIFGSACGCRFAPTCSHYAIEAVRAHGAIVGLGLAIVRLVKCTPLHPGGFDPVPARTRFSCVNVSKITPAQG